MVEDDVNAGLAGLVLFSRYSAQSLNLFEALVAKYGQEAVVNADFALRTANALTHCSFDKRTKLNLIAPDLAGNLWRFVPACTGA